MPAGAVTKTSVAKFDAVEKLAADGTASVEEGLFKLAVGDKITLNRKKKGKLLKLPGTLKIKVGKSLIKFAAGSCKFPVRIGDEFGALPYCSPAFPIFRVVSTVQHVRRMLG